MDTPRTLGKIDMSNDKPNNKDGSVLPGLAAIGLVITGCAGIHHTYYTGSGVGLIASAISFGVILVISFI